jgi:hypothetical protein
VCVCVTKSEKVRGERRSRSSCFGDIGDTTEEKRGEKKEQRKHVKKRHATVCVIKIVATSRSLIQSDPERQKKGAAFVPFALPALSQN